MGTTASMLTFRESPTNTNVYAFLMTGYFVVTALTTVRPVSPWTRRTDVAALIVVLGLAIGTMVGGFKAFNSPGLSPGSVPFRTIGVMSFVLAAAMVVGGRRSCSYSAPCSIGCGGSAAVACRHCSCTTCGEGWSGRRGSNPRPTAWEAVTLPLRYSRSAVPILS